MSALKISIVSLLLSLLLKGIAYSQQDGETLEISDVSIVNGEKRNYRATYSITFGPGFSTGEGVHLTATIVSKQQTTEEKIKELKLDESFNVYPNPFSNEIFLEASNLKMKFNISIYDVHGKLVYTEDNIEKNGRINLERLQSGVYVLKLSDSKSSTTKQIIKL